MAPVEIESIPSFPPAEVASSLKTVDKALELPIVNDAVHMAAKLHQQAMQFPTYNHVEAIFANGVGMVDAGLSQGVKSRVAVAVSSLDSLASSGLDKLTTSVPALATPTEEILPTITGTITASTVTDYVASFGVVQSGLKLVDTALSLGEKAVRSLAPSLEEASLAGGLIKQVRVARRALRAIRHAGRRAGGHEGSGGVADWILNVLHINAILGFFGLALTKSGEDGPIATSGESDVEETNDDETLAEKLVKDYGNESQDPDYVPGNASEDSLEYKSDEDALEASQDKSQESTSEELEASQDESQESTSEELEASQDESQEAQEQPAPVIEAPSEVEASQDKSQESTSEEQAPASEEPEASLDESQDAEEQPVAIEAASEEPEVGEDKSEDLEASLDESQEAQEQPVVATEPASEELEASEDKSQDPASKEQKVSLDESQETPEKPATVIEATESFEVIEATEALENKDDSEEEIDFPKISR